jgi:hypothetical protein
VWRGDDNTGHPVVVNERAAADRTEPDVGAQVQQSLTPPIGFLLKHPTRASRNRGGETHPVAVIVAGNLTGRAYAAQHVVEFHDQHPRPLAGRSDARRGPAGPAADHYHVVTAQHGQVADVLRNGGPLLERPHTGQQLADFAGRSGSRVRFVRTARQPHTGQVARVGRLLGSRGTDPLSQIDPFQRTHQPRGAGAADVRRSAQHVQPVHPLRPKGIQRQRVDRLPVALDRLPTVHCVGRHLKQPIGSDLLSRVIRERAGRLVGGDERAPTAIGHVEFERVLDRLERSKRLNNAHRPAFQRHRLAADDHAAKGLHAGGIGAEARTGQAGHRTPLGGVDDRAGKDRLAAGAVGHHNPRRCPPGVAQHVGRVATEQEIDTGVQQRLLQRRFDVQRARRSRFGGQRIVVDRHGQRRLRLLAFLQPQLQRGRHVVAQVGMGRGQEDPRTRLGRRHRRRNRTGAPADHDHVHFVGYRNLSRRLDHGVRSHRQHAGRCPYQGRHYRGHRLSSNHLCFSLVWVKNLPQPRAL